MKPITKTFILLLTATTVSGNHHAMDNNDETISLPLRQDVKEPYYVIDFSAVSCKFEIQINKASVFSMNVDGQVGTEIPCNFMIFESGRQQLDIIVYPSTGNTEFAESTDFSAKVKLYDVVDKFELVEDDILVWKMSDDDKTGAICRHTAFFNADVPYRLNTWQQSADLNAVENLREKVETAYQKLGEMITKKQYDAFKNCMQEREKRMAVSMYLDQKSSKERMDELIKNFKEGFEWIPLSGDETMHIYADGKLVCLKTKDDESALQFRNKKTDDEIEVEIMFHLKEGDTELSVSP